MPVIHTYASTPITFEQRESLKATFGEAIATVPGKSEQWLMCLFEENMPIYLAGNGEDPAALVTVDVCSGEPIVRAVWEGLTVTICGALKEQLGIDPTRIYIRYGTTPDFGWNNINF